MHSSMLSRYDVELDVRKIAVLRVNRLGDFIFAVPALEALRAAYPAAEIVLLAKDWHAAFLAGRPGPVDRVVVVPPARGVGEEPDFAEDPGRLERFFAAMARERFDLAIQIHGGGRYSNPFLLRLGARLTVGLKTPDAAPLDRWVPYVYFQPEVLRYLEVVALVGATTRVLEPRIAVTAQDLAEAERVVPPAGDPTSVGSPLVALHPGGTDPRRWWPADKFAAVGDALAAAGAHVVVTGTKGERHVVEAVLRAMTFEAQDLCAQLSLGGLAGLLSRCRVVVANDSGPLHLAASVGAATVGIFWCFNLINWGPLTRSHHRPSVSWRLTCPVCGIDDTQERCTHRASFVADVPTEEVVASALDLFAAAS
jgi:ADP-heptose:LPS heptosyltransferase